MNTRKPSPWLHLFAVLAAASTLLLIVAGALVVGNDAGLSVPDWPLSYGTWMPPMEGGVFYEHGHRMIATSVGFLTVVLAVWLWRSEARRWMRGLGAVAVAAVIVQGVLGGITVLYLLPTPVSVGHACLAQAFFCLMLSLALFTSTHWQEPLEPKYEAQSPAFRHLCAATAGAVFVQLVLGATLRHKALSLTPHLLWAGVVAVLITWVALRAAKLRREQPLLRKLSLVMLSVLFAQLLLGLGSYLSQPTAHVHAGAHVQQAAQPNPLAVWITTAHVAVGALLLGTSWLLTLLAYRNLAAPKKVLSLAGSPEKTWA
ncbi:MAG: COX15/CtaA family protein [Acidobacteria bacterium]|nr:COX15/CtaA family protein [Acidobacteriota bacterium]